MIAVAFPTGDFVISDIDNEDEIYRYRPHGD